MALCIYIHIYMAAVLIENVACVSTLRDSAPEYIPAR